MRTSRAATARPRPLEDSKGSLSWIEEYRERTLSSSRRGTKGRRMSGPLSQLKVVELQGRGPGPFGAMVLADLGADVVRIARLADVAPDGDESGMERMIRGHRRLDLGAGGRRSVAR